MIRPRFLSLGAGVQSSALLVLLDREDVLTGAIFADTGWEPPAVYDHLERLEGLVEAPIHRATAGNIRRDVLEAVDGGGGRFASLPLYTRKPDGKVSMLRRQCTWEYKIRVVRRKIRELLGMGDRGDPSRPISMLLGISLDEVQRAKPSGTEWIQNEWPLLFDYPMTRHDCKRWWLDNVGPPLPPRSACIGCPFHTDKEWREMKEERPEEWAEAVAFDRAIRSLPRINNPCFLHRSGQPLEDVDLRSAEELGQTGFLAECTGHCGL